MAASKMDKVTAKLITLGVTREVAEERVKQRKLTDEDVDWNLRFGRPVQWKETVDPDAEAKRRADYTKREQDLAEAQGVLAPPSIPIP